MNTPVHPSTLVLQRYGLGELGDEDNAVVVAHLGACERCRRRYGTQQEQRASFDEAIPPALEALAPANRSWPLFWVVPIVLVAAAATLLVVIPPPAVETTRVKGDLPAIELWVKAPEGARPVRPGEALAAGATVQVEYDGHGRSHLWLLGRDGTGAIEVYGPLPPTSKLAPAPFALTLDGAPGPQELFVVGSDERLTPDEVVRAIREPMRGVRVDTVSVAKVP